jgi:hypothetical protein
MGKTLIHEMSMRIDTPWQNQLALRVHGPFCLDLRVREEADNDSLVDQNIRNHRLLSVGNSRVFDEKIVTHLINTPSVMIDLDLASIFKALNRGN